MGHGEAMLGDRVRVPPIAKRQGVGEDGLHVGRPGAPWMVDAECATPAEQMCQTALVQRVGEAAIGRPAIANQDPGEVGAQDRGRVVKAAPGTNRIHGGLGGRERHSQCNTAPTRQPVSSGLTTGLPRIWAHRSAYVGVATRAARCRVWTRPPGMTRRPKRSRSSAAIFSSDTPTCLCKSTTRVTAPGPRCTLAAPNASEVCRGCRPWTRRPQATQQPTSTSNRRTIGRTTGRSS